MIRKLWLSKKGQTTNTCIFMKQIYIDMLTYINEHRTPNINDIYMCHFGRWVGWFGSLICSLKISVGGESNVKICVKDTCICTLYNEIHDMTAHYMIVHHKRSYIQYCHAACCSCHARLFPPKRTVAKLGSV